MAQIKNGGNQGAGNGNGRREMHGKAESLPELQALKGDLVKVNEDLGLAPREAEAVATIGVHAITRAYGRRIQERGVRSDKEGPAL
jgi:hypothetical protein